MTISDLVDDLFALLDERHEWRISDSPHGVREVLGDSYSELLEAHRPTLTTTLTTAATVDDFAIFVAVRLFFAELQFEAGFVGIESDEVGREMEAAALRAAAVVRGESVGRARL